jgi:hypothetical protein
MDVHVRTSLQGDYVITAHDAREEIPTRVEP